MGVFGLAEDGGEEAAGGIIDRGQEDKGRPAVFEPGMMAAIELDQEAAAGHAEAAPPMAWGAPGARGADAAGAQEALQTASGEVQPFALGEQFTQVMIIHASISATGEGQHAGAQGEGQAPWRWSAARAVGEALQPIGAQLRQEASDMPHGEAQQPSGDPCGKAAGLGLREYMGGDVVPLGQGDRLPRHDPRVTFSLACWRVTFSLA